VRTSSFQRRALGFADRRFPSLFTGLHSFLLPLPEFFSVLLISSYEALTFWSEGLRSILFLIGFSGISACEPWASSVFPLPALCRQLALFRAPSVGFGSQLRLRSCRFPRSRFSPQSRRSCPLLALMDFIYLVRCKGFSLISAETALPLFSLSVRSIHVSFPRGLQPGSTGFSLAS
jgi:hypothetical protein